MSHKRPATFAPGAPVTVYGQWPGIVKGGASGGYVVQYEKHGGNLVSIIPASRLTPRKLKGTK